MVKIVIKKEESGRYLGFESLGHAEYSTHGKDIVCSALSLLLINTINSIESIALCKVEVHTNQKSGLMEVNFDDDFNEAAQILMESMILGIRSIMEEYGKKYVSLEIRKH